MASRRQLGALVAVLNAADLWLTHRVLAAGGDEANPVMASLFAADREWVKLALPALVMALCFQPVCARWPTVVLYPVVAMYGAAVGWGLGVWYLATPLA